MPLDVISERLVPCLRPNGIRLGGRMVLCGPLSFCIRKSWRVRGEGERGRERERLGKEEGVVDVLGK